MQPLIELPDSLTMTRDRGQEKLLTDSAREMLEKEERSPGIHATDLLDERLAFWNRVNPGPVPDRLVPVFLIGKVLHALVLNGLGGKELHAFETDAGSEDIAELGITASPDFVDDEDVPTELKTSRGYYEPKTPGDVAMYLEQLLIYMASKNKTKGRLAILFLNFRDKETYKTTPAFRSYTIEISPADLAALRAEIAKKAERLKAAVDAKDPSSLGFCREWKCGEDQCGHWHLCKPDGRYGLERFAAKKTKGAESGQKQA